MASGTIKTNRITKVLTKTTDVNGRFYLEEVPSNAYDVVANMNQAEWRACLPPFKVSSSIWASRAFNDHDYSAFANQSITVTVTYSI